MVVNTKREYERFRKQIRFCARVWKVFLKKIYIYKGPRFTYYCDKIRMLKVVQAIDSCVTVNMFTANDTQSHVLRYSSVEKHLSSNKIRIIQL